MRGLTRREILQMTASCVAISPLASSVSFAAQGRRSRMKLGLVTYQWAKDWDLPTLIANCEETGFLGVELRTTHGHGVEPSLSAAELLDVKKRFADSKIKFISIGSNEDFDSPDADELKASIKATKAYVKLSHDIGGSGVKVKPNSFHDDVPQEQTIEQIGKSLNIVGKYAGELGQQIRLEVHGGCSHLPTIKKIMDVADNKNVAVCWNCNSQDLEGEGLEHNFKLVRDRFGDTAHVRELNIGDYPYQKLIDLMVASKYDGWVLLEARTNPEDKIAALKEQRKVWREMIKKAAAKV